MLHYAPASADPVLWLNLSTASFPAVSSPVDQSTSALVHPLCASVPCDCGFTLSLSCCFYSFFLCLVLSVAKIHSVFLLLHQGNQSISAPDATSPIPEFLITLRELVLSFPSGGSCQGYHSKPERSAGYPIGLRSRLEKGSAAPEEG